MTVGVATIGMGGVILCVCPKINKNTGLGGAAGRTSHEGLLCTGEGIREANLFRKENMFWKRIFVHL